MDEEFGGEQVPMPGRLPRISASGCWSRFSVMRSSTGGDVLVEGEDDGAKAEPTTVNLLEGKLNP